MVDFTDMVEADDAMRRAMIENWDTLPELEREEMFRLGRIGVNPVDRLVKRAELVYSVHEAMPVALKEAAAGVMRFGAINGWHGLNERGRGDNAAKVLDGQPIEEVLKPKKRRDLFHIEPYVSTEAPIADEEPVEPTNAGS